MATTQFAPTQTAGPSSIDAERSVLGAILLNSSHYFEASEYLLPEDFAFEGHRKIYSRIRQMMEAENGRIKVDLISVLSDLRSQGLLDAVGGTAYLAQLTEGLPARDSIAHWVRIVKDKSILRRLISMSQMAIAKAEEQSESIIEIVGSVETAMMELGQETVTRAFKRVPQIVSESFGSIDALYERAQRITGLETYYKDLDDITSGLQKQDLIIIAARPSMGKTAFAMNIAENTAVNDGSVVAVCSLEMSASSLLLRMLCSASHVDSQKLRTGFLGKDEYSKLVDGLAKLSEAPLFIDDTAGLSIPELRAKLRRLKHEQKRLDLVVVDYLQLMSAATGSGARRYDNRTQEVSAISRGLKMIAKELNVPLIALSQLSRAPENRGGKDSEPKLSDLRESGSIEQDADVVMFIYRPEYYDRDNPEVQNKAKLLIAKQRNGPTDTIQLAFHKQFTRFETMDRSDWMHD